MAQKPNQRSILLILGDQLFPHKEIKALPIGRVFMAEDYDLCENVHHHKQKITLFFSAMRTYAEELRAKKISVEYRKLSRGRLCDKLRTFVEEEGIQEVHYFTIDDQPFRQEFVKALEGFKLTEHRSPKHLSLAADFEAYLKGKKRPFMKTFYEDMRRRHQLLMDGDKPFGGKFSFDTENRKKLPAKVQIPPRKQQARLPVVKEVAELVQKEFPDHPGTLEDFRWPVSREAYLKVISDFMNSFIEGFGPYQDALSGRDPFLFHSLLSPGLNLGLITPADVLERLLPIAEKRPDLIASVEGFLRQLVGWREFVRGIYEHFYEPMQKTNHWQATRKLKPCWWEGTTGLPPVDDVIRKCIDHGYAHHIERLMVMGSIFNLVQAQPKQVYRWFMEMFVDSADWVMQANVYGMGLMSDGGLFATKPYICGSNYILKMSDYKSGPWCDILDGLYWQFIHRHRGFFAGNPRMAMMVRMYDKIPQEKLKRIDSAARRFVQKTTTA